MAKKMTTQLNFQHAETLKLSAVYAERYVEQHEIVKDGLTADMAKTLACSRLEWLLQVGRAQLSGMWTEKDIVTMLNCLRDELLYTGQSFLTAVCNDLGLRPNSYQFSPYKKLVNNLRALSHLQMLALTDALEQLWHRGLHQSGSIAEFLETLGIKLREKAVHA